MLKAKFSSYIHMILLFTYSRDPCFSFVCAKSVDYQYQHLPLGPKHPVLNLYKLGRIVFLSNVLLCKFEISKVSQFCLRVKPKF